MTRLDKHQKKEIANRYQAGESGRQLSEAFKVSESTISRYIQGRGMHMSRRKKFTSSEQLLILKLWPEGYSTHYIMQKLGLKNDKSVRTFLLDRGYQLERRYKSVITRRIGKRGYAYIRQEKGWALEHRVVMSRYLGRPLEPHETVHHKNGDRADNRLENLQLRSGNHGQGVVHQCRTCGSHDIVAVNI